MTSTTTPKRSGWFAVFRSAFTPQRVVISLALALAGFCLILAFTQSVDQQPRTSLRPRQVVDLQPEEGAPLAVRQGAIAAQLAPGWTGRLQIDGKDIPDDQTERPASGLNASGASPGIAGLNRYSFTPGPGKELTTVGPGPHTATIIFWPTTLEEGAAGTDRYTWHFNAG